MTRDPAPYVDAEIQDGGTLATDTTTVIIAAAGTYSLNFTINRLKEVRRVINLELNTNPLTNAGVPSLYFYAQDNVQNRIGITLCGLGTGSTITAYLTCLGT